MATRIILIISGILEFISKTTFYQTKTPIPGAKPIPTAMAPPSGQKEPEKPKEELAKPIEEKAQGKKDVNFCTECGKEIKENAEFCNECGKKVKK